MNGNTPHDMGQWEDGFPNETIYDPFLRALTFVRRLSRKDRAVAWAMIERWLSQVHSGVFLASELAVCLGMRPEHTQKCLARLLSCGVIEVKEGRYGATMDWRKWKYPGATEPIIKFYQYKYIVFGNERSTDMIPF